jgi:hypothetical protein
MSEKISVENFVKRYNEKISKNDEQVLDKYLQSIVNVKYVPYEQKINACRRVIEATHYKKGTDKNGIKTKELHINSPAEYMLFHISLIENYTQISINYSNTLSDFDLLSETGLLDKIISYIPENEYRLMNAILNMLESDVLRNEYEMHSFISNQVEKFGRMVGEGSTLIMDKFGEILKNVDEKKINKIVNGITQLIK